MVNAATRERVDALVRELYVSVPYAARRIASECGVTQKYVLARVHQAGLSRPYRKWTVPEIEYVKKHEARISAGVMARKLKRSRNDIYRIIRHYCHGSNGSGYTAAAVACALGVAQETVIRHIALGTMKARKKMGNGKGDLWMMYDEDVRDFLRRHPLAWNLSRADQLWVIDILAGVIYEPMQEDDGGN